MRRVLKKKYLNRRHPERSPDDLCRDEVEGSPKESSTSLTENVRCAQTDNFFPLYIVVGVIALIVLFIAGCQREDTSPRQPIAFSHARHAGDFKIGCQYCHSGVRRGPNAYIPSVQTCMGCHKLVAATKPEVIKIRQAWEAQQPIQWTKVNQVADFVYFNHYPHIAKGIDCKNCHGDIASMTEVKPHIALNNMSFCVDCHRQNNASIDCYTCHR